MATVQSLTKDRLVALEDATVIDGYINGSGHLILVTHDATEIDAGYALVAVPDASTTVRGAVELATEAETTARTDATRAVTPAGLVATYNDLDGQISAVDSAVTALDGRVDALEAEPGERVQLLTADSMDEVDVGTLYPLGVSMMKVDNASTWTPSNYGLVITYYRDQFRIVQYFHQDPFTSNDVWMRGYHSTSGWTPWAQFVTSYNLSSSVSGHILRHNGTNFVSVAEQDYLFSNKRGIKGFNADSAAACTTSYANMGSSSFSFTKRYTGTRLRLHATGTCWSTTGTTGIYLGIRINGTDYDVAELIANVPDFRHLAYSGVVYLAASVIAAGTYTIQGRWKAQNGSGTIHSDTNDNYFFEVEELMP